jgi:hypothetical protein
MMGLWTRSGSLRKLLCGQRRPHCTEDKVAAIRFMLRRSTATSDTPRTPSFNAVGEIDEGVLPVDHSSAIAL